jgi:hypothetical protein
MPSKPELLLTFKTFKLTIFLLIFIELELLMNKSLHENAIQYSINFHSFMHDTISNDCETHFFEWKVVNYVGVSVIFSLEGMRPCKFP